MRVVGVHDGVALAARDQPAVDRDVTTTTATSERDGEAPQNSPVAQTGVQGTRHEQEHEVVRRSPSSRSRPCRPRARPDRRAQRIPARSSGRLVSR